MVAILCGLSVLIFSVFYKAYPFSEAFLAVAKKRYP